MTYSDDESFYDAVSISPNFQFPFPPQRQEILSHNEILNDSISLSIKLNKNQQRKHYMKIKSLPIPKEPPLPPVRKSSIKYTRSRLNSYSSGDFSQNGMIPNKTLLSGQTFVESHYTLEDPFARLSHNCYFDKDIEQKFIYENSIHAEPSPLSSSTSSSYLRSSIDSNSLILSEFSDDRGTIDTNIDSSSTFSYKGKRDGFNSNGRSSLSAVSELDEQWQCEENSTLPFVNKDFVAIEGDMDSISEIHEMNKIPVQETQAVWQKILLGLRKKNKKQDSRDFDIKSNEKDFNKKQDSRDFDIKSNEKDFNLSEISNNLDPMKSNYDGFRNIPDNHMNTFNQIAVCARSYFNVSTTLISLFSKDMQWYKAEVGWDGIEKIPITARDISLCGHTFLKDKPIIILDTLKDEKFMKNINILEHNVGFYVGIPIMTLEGYRIGTICLVDNQPRSYFSNDDMKKLIEFADIIMREAQNRYHIELKNKMFRMEMSIAHFNQQVDEWYQKISHYQKRRNSIISISDNFHPLDQAMKMISQTINVPLTYFIHSSTKSRTCSLISSFGFSKSSPPLDPESHINVLNSENGIFYQNPESSEILSNSSHQYCSGILIPINRYKKQHNQQIKVSKGILNSARLGEFSQEKQIQVCTSNGETLYIPMDFELFNENEPYEIVSYDIEETEGFILAVFTKNKNQTFGMDEVKYLQTFGLRLSSVVTEEQINGLNLVHENEII